MLDPIRRRLCKARPSRRAAIGLALVPMGTSVVGHHGINLLSSQGGER